MSRVSRLSMPMTILAISLPVARAEPVKSPAWVHDVTRMAFLTPGQVELAAKAGVQVVHGNAVWPYFPLRNAGGGLPAAEDKLLRKFVENCHGHGMKLVLGLPPFASVELVKKHPEWRVHPEGGVKPKGEPDEKSLGARLCCNQGPWGDYLIEICAELVRDYKLDGYSFDGNYHASLCHCPACTRSYRRERQRDLPARSNLDDIAYREYLVWRGEKLEDHYRRLRQRLQQINPNAVIMTWTVNAGRYGHYLHSPRAMSTRLNLLFDLPMQEWWLDETNFGASVAPAFGAAYLRAVAGDRPNASEAYLMSRGNPYGTDSFPVHERLTRNFLALANGSIAAESFGWPGHLDSTMAVFREVKKRERWLTRTETLPWAGLLVSEQTRQFYAYKDIPERFLSHLFGAFRTGMEEHLPLRLLNDWDVNDRMLLPHAVVVLANAAALSDGQVKALREYVRNGGGLVATAETSLCDELGRPRGDFALADVFGVSYQGRPRVPLKRPQRPELDPNFAIAIDESYWKNRTGLATLTWSDHELLRDARLEQLVPGKRATFRGPLVSVSRPKDGAVIAIMTPDGGATESPAIVARSFGKGRVVYLAAGLDAAMWSYAYPYQRRMLARAIAWAAREPAPIEVKAPMCVQATYYRQPSKDGQRTIVHLFNGMNTTANHGLPAADVPLREETVPIHDIEVRFLKSASRSFRLQPGNRVLAARCDGAATVVVVPRLDMHAILVGEQ